MKLRHLLFQASIARTLLGGFLLVIIPTFILGLTSSAVGINLASSEISNSYANSIELLSRQMADIIYNMDMLSASFLLDDNLVAFANNEGKNSELYDYMIFQKRMQLYRTPQFIDANIVVCLPRQGWMISTNNGVTRMDGKVESIRQAAAGRGSAIWSIQKSLMNPGQDSLLVFRGYVREKQSSPFIIIEISREEMESALETMSDNTQVLHTFFIDPFGELFSSGNDLDEPLTQQVMTELSDDHEGGNTHDIIKYKGKSYRLLYQTVGDYNCKIGMLFDDSDVLRPIINVRIIFIIFMIFAVSASGLFIVTTYRKVFTPLHSLVSTMSVVESGNLNVKVEDARNNEFSIISRQFNTMVSRLDKLITESYVKEIELKNTQLRFLRTQVNPHFLYNSLFSLYSMIQNGDLDCASDMAVYLGKYYQRNAHLNERELTIAEEAENIRMYVRIMSLRFPERIQLVTEIDEQTSRWKIPVLSLQTIVENAVLHGMERTSEVCTITVATRIKDMVLSMLVTDTGGGMPAERIDAVRNRIANVADIDDKHGLENAYARLKLMYGDDVSMDILNNHPTGIKVEIKIPVNEGGQDVQPVIG